MAGPLGTIAPTTDPNWAWDTPGWTNQGNTSDVEGAQLSAPGQGSMLVEPAALSGYIARSMDPDVTSGGGTSTTTLFVTGTPFLFSMQVMDPVVTTGVAVAGAAAGPPTHSIAALYSASSGQLVANTADLGASGFGTAAAKIPWAATTALSAGYYWVLLVESSGTMGTLTSFTLAAESQLLLSNTGAPIPFLTGTTPRFGIGSTGLTGMTATPAGLVTLGTLTTSMVVTKNTKATFVGLY